MAPGALQCGGPHEPGERLPARLTPTVAFSLSWTSDKHCYVSLFSLPLFDSQTKGKHKLRKPRVRRSEGGRRGGSFPVHCSLPAAAPLAAVPPASGAVGRPLRSPHLITEGTLHPTGDPENNHTPCARSQGPAWQPPTAPTSLRPPSVSRSDVLSS